MTGTEIWLLTLVYVIITFLRINWGEVRSFSSANDTFAPTHLPSATPRNNLNVLGSGGALWLYAVSAAVGGDGSGSNASLTTLTLVGGVLLWWLARHADWVVNTAITWLVVVGYLLVLAPSIFHFYLLMEISAYTSVLMLLLVTAGRGGEDARFVSIALNFIVNFLSSIVFFLLVVDSGWAGLSGGWDVAYPTAWHTSLLGVVVVLKGSLGVWLLAGVWVYSGFSLLYLLVYAVQLAFFAFPVLLGALTQSGAATGLMTLSCASVGGLIASTGLAIRSLKALLGVSSGILYLYLVLMVTL